MSSFAERRSHFAQRESSLRREFTESRLARLGKAKALFGPCLASRTTDTSYLDISTVSNAQRDPNGAFENEQAIRFQLESKALTLAERADFLCDVIKTAITAGNMPILSLAVDLSTMLLEDLGRADADNARLAQRAPLDSRAAPAIAAFREVVSQEQDLSLLRSLADRDKPRPVLQGTVEGYAFSRAHDAIVCIVTDNIERHIYPALKLDALPPTRTDVTIYWVDDRGHVDECEHEPQRLSGQRERKASA